MVEYKNLTQKAYFFAENAHKGQVRKYTGDDYIVHPVRVAELVIGVLTSQEIPVEIYMDGLTMIRAAYLHDVVEDCNITVQELEVEFNKNVAYLVYELTNEFTKEKYPQHNRNVRHNLEHARIAKISRAAKLIKLCDRLDNLRDIPLEEPFLKKYIPESQELLEVLKGTHSGLEKQLQELIDSLKAEVYE